MLEIKEDSNKNLRLRIKVRPSASKTGIIGTENGMLVVAVAAPPDKGKANKELERFLARKLGVSREDVSIVSGMKTRHKTVLVKGLDLQVCERRLLGEKG